MRKNNLRIEEGVKFPLDYPGQLRKYSWCFKNICGPAACWRPSYSNTQKDSPLFWKNALITQMQRQKWNIDLNDEEITLRIFEQLVNFLVKSFTICYTENEGFFVTCKKDKDGNKKINYFDLFSIGEKLNLNHKQTLSLVKKLFSGVLELYRKMS